MKSFQEYIRERKIVKRSIEPAEARSLFSQAKERLADLEQLPLNDKNASFRYEDAYETLRESLQAFIAFDGYKTYSHEAIFVYAFENKLLNEADTYTADRYSEIRSDINYRGKKVTVEEAKEIIEFIKRILPELEKKFNIKGNKK